MKDAPGTRDYDWWLLAILATICALGVLEIYSATKGSSLAGMHMKQVRWLLIGFVLMFALSRLDYHLILDQAPILYLIGLASLAAVLLVGHTHFGAKRWISVPVLGELVQVSELVKLIIIIVLARFFAEVRTDELDLRDLIKAGILVGIPLVLILKQPDLGTALVLMPMLAVGAFLAGLKWQHAAVFSLAGILLVGAVFYPPVSRHLLKPYQRDRITSFLHPEGMPKAPAINCCNPRSPWVPAASGAKGLATAVRINWATSPCDIRISSCRRGRKNRDSRACFWPWDCIWRFCYA